MQSEKIVFEGRQGELAARLDLPIERPRAYALFAHCFTCSKDVFAATRIAQGLAELGVATLRFDFTGLGESGGEFANSDFTANIADLVAAARFLAQNYEAPRLLIGHSLGGAAVLAAAGQIASADVVATIGAPFDPGHVGRLFAEKRPEIEATGEAKVTIAGRRFRVTREFLDDIGSQDQATRIADLRRPLIIFHSPVDQIVGIEHAARIFTTAKHPKSFISLDKADHLLSRRQDAAYVAQVLVAWARRYIAGLEPPEFQSRFTPDGEHVVVAEAGVGKFTQLINAAGHPLLSDEPLEVGGDNRGPSPYGLLLSALGACTAMTIRMYAEHKGLKLAHVSVRLKHDRIHAEDCADCEAREGKIDVITRDVSLEGDLVEADRARLLQIADKCPVHRTLHGEVKVRTKLVS